VHRAKPFERLLPVRFTRLALRRVQGFTQDTLVEWAPFEDVGVLAQKGLRWLAKCGMYKRQRGERVLPSLFVESSKVYNMMIDVQR